MNTNKRIETLKEELAKGEQMLAALDARRREVREQMLRISGAIQVLQEMQNESAQPVLAHANGNE